MHHVLNPARRRTILALLFFLLLLSPACQPATPTVAPAAPSGGPEGFFGVSDKDFNYEITVPAAWGRTALNGRSLGLDEWPQGSAIYSNVASPSLQSSPPGADFLLTVSREPVGSEDALLTVIARQVVAKEGDLLRRTQGKWVEYYTASPVTDAFGRPAAGRWFWDGKMLLTVSVLIRNPRSALLPQVDAALASVRLLTQ